jgi:hypothetical protein
MPHGAEEGSELPALEFGLPAEDILQAGVGRQGGKVPSGRSWEGIDSGLVLGDRKDPKSVMSKK